MRQSPAAFGLTAQKTLDILQLPFIAGRRFPVVVQRPIPMVLLVEDHRNFAVAVFGGRCSCCAGRVHARRCATTGAGMVETVQKTVEVSAVGACSWTRLLTCPVGHVKGCRGSAVAVHRLVCGSSPWL